MESPTSSALLRRVLEKVSHTTRGILSWNCHFTNITAAYCYSVDEFDLAKIALSCQFALDFLCCKEGVRNSGE